MGGDRENFATGSIKTTQGMVESGQRLRFHENAGQVHFHDDVLKLKAAIPVADWWKAWDKLRTSPGRWEWFDSVNETVLLIETKREEEIEANLSLFRSVYGVNFKALDLFTKKK